MSHHKSFDSLCDCFGCTRSVMCGFNGADRCAVCIFDMKSSKHLRKCLMCVCTKMSVKEKKECIRQYDRLLSDHIQESVLSEGADVFCCWHINGRRSWGKVLKRYQCNDFKSDLYDVRFQDDLTRKNMKRIDIFDAWEYNVWMEKIRLLQGDLIYLSINESTRIQRSEVALTCDKKSPNQRKRPHNDSSCFPTKLVDKRLTRGSHFSPSELFQRRCRTCTSCILPDCGKCESCLVNQTLTSRERQVCWLKLCKKVSKEFEIKLPAVDGWSFFFSDNVSKCPSSISHLPTVYHKLRLLHASKGNMSMNIFDAVHACDSDDERSKLSRFFEVTFGCKLHETTNHVLVGKGYYHISFSKNGDVRDFQGKISHCFKHMVSGELLFAIQYTELPKSSVMYSNELSVELVSEYMAWGGYKSYSLYVSGGSLIDENTMSRAPFHIQWNVPSHRKVERAAQQCYPTLILEYKGSKLQFDVKPSMIPGAGNGFFVKCIGGKDLVLEPGEMLDLGVYAPLHDSAIKSKHISLVKNLLFDWQIETWVFAARQNKPDAFVYDPTEDFSGLPNISTQMNGICFVNEINGKSETACVTAQYDPEGNIHYLFGHWEEHEGPMTISSNGNVQELLIDYGESYERCRLRNGYSREGLISEHHQKQARFEDDEAAVSDFSSFAANQICDCLSFFETLYARGWLKASTSNHQRALLILFCLDDRLDAIVNELKGFDMSIDEFCDGGFTNLHVDDVKARFRTLIATACSHFPGRKLKEGILSMKLLRVAASKRLHYEAKESTLNWRTLGSELINA